MVQGQLRAEALPQAHDGDLGRERRSQPQHRDQGRHATCWRKIPTRPGSLGIAISEAVEDAATHEDTNYCPGQRAQPRHACTRPSSAWRPRSRWRWPASTRTSSSAAWAAASNFGGIAFPFVQDKMQRQEDRRIIAVEPAACPTLTKGEYAYDFGDTAKMTPLVKMYTLGTRFMPPPIHAGGLRYHGMSPLVSLPTSTRLIEAVAVHAATAVSRRHPQFARTEGIIPAPESSHAISVGHRRGDQGQGGRQEEDDRLQPERSRSLRPGGLRHVPLRQARRTTSIRRSSSRRP